jgi:nucleoside 2-deoxyribosyltransferase
MGRDFIIYLAGPILGTTYGESTEWREYARDRLAALDPALRGASPMRAKKYLADLAKMPMTADQLRSTKTGTIKTPLSTAAAIVGRDQMDVARADLLLVNLLGAQKVSIGTCCEVAQAHQLRVPVMLVIEDEGNIHDHPFITQQSAFRVDDLDMAINLIPAILIPDIEEDGELI